MHLTTLSFPEIKLRQSDGHKLRGYFSKIFGDESDLFHNHNADGSAIYRYPRIQFKVIEQVPYLIGLDDGAALLVERFMQIKELKLDDRTYTLNQKNIKSLDLSLGLIEDLISYKFLSPWMALNQKNHTAYLTMDTVQQAELLKRILTSNMLSYMKAFGCLVESKVLVQHSLNTITTQFKNQTMVAFKGQFTTNALLPDFIGLGKSVARGYGAIKKIA